MPPLIPDSIINRMSMSVSNSKFTFVFFKDACHANPGADKKSAGPSSYIFMHVFLNLSNTSVMITYLFQHISRAILLSFLIQMHHILFEHARNLHQ